MANATNEIWSEDDCILFIDTTNVKVSPDVNKNNY